MAWREARYKLRRGLALTGKESWDLNKYIETLEQQSCKDCISREDAINKIEEWADGFEEGGYFSGKSVADAIRACGGIIAELPPVTPKVESEAEK